MKLTRFANYRWSTVKTAKVKTATPKQRQCKQNGDRIRGT